MALKKKKMIEINTETGKVKAEPRDIQYWENGAHPLYREWFKVDKAQQKGLANV